MLGQVQGGRGPCTPPAPLQHPPTSSPTLLAVAFGVCTGEVSEASSGHSPLPGEAPPPPARHLSRLPAPGGFVLVPHGRARQVDACARRAPPSFNLE